MIYASEVSNAAWREHILMQKSTLKNHSVVWINTRLVLCMKAAISSLDTVNTEQMPLTEFYSSSVLVLLNIFAMEMSS